MTATAEAPTRGTPAPRTRGRSSWGVRRVLFWVMLVLLSLVFVAPLLWMFLTSFKTPGSATNPNSSALPNPFDTASYSSLFHSGSTPVLRWFVNSLVAGLANTALIVVVDSLAAYALARLEFAGKRIIFGVVIGTIFVPTFVFLVPNFLIVSRLGWLDSLWAIIVPSAGGAFGVFFLRQFFMSLPRELEEAAILDGANHWRVFTTVVLPLSKPALSTLAILSFLTNWNDFLWPVFVLFTAPHLTLPAGLSTLQSAAVTNYPLIMAGAVVASVPAIILFILAQRQVIESVARSGLKG
jgi:multiple sugar transport system permease protein